MYVRWTPSTSAKASCERPSASRYARKRRPTAFCSSPSTVGKARRRPVHRREVDLFVAAVAERLCAGVAAAAESDRVVDRIRAAFAVKERDAALDEVGAVV